ncbi:MAG TPA: LpqB family beta-propeller domain-containing protein [Micromonosporaceae bacterium]
MRVPQCVAAALVMATALAGCGVPDSGLPVSDGTAPGILVPDASPEPLPRPEDAENSKDAVELYFEAASSEWAILDQQVRPFLSKEARPPQGDAIHVVADLQVSPPLNDQPDLHPISVTGRVIGELTENGVLLPASRRFSYIFKIERNRAKDNQRSDSLTWLVTNPPPYYVLSDQALRERYQFLSLYFGNRRSTASLIPDLRYIPEAVTWQKQWSLLVDWLLQGPSPWLEPVAVVGFASGTKRRGNVYLDGRRVVVNLNSDAEKTPRMYLALAQLVWTLDQRMEPGLRLQLQIDDRPVPDGLRTTHSRRDFGGFNAVPAQTTDASAYHITDEGQVASLVAGELPAVLTGQYQRYNTSVISAALSQNGDLAALVRDPPKDLGGQKLWVGRLSTRYQEVTDLPAGPIGRPVWVADIGGPLGSLLVTATGRLYQVDVGKLDVLPVRLTSQVREVTAVSVAPDGHRAALISGGMLYVAGLVQREGVTAIESPRLVTDRFRGAADVAWRGEHTLVVTARDPSRGGLWEVGIDGLRVARLLPERGIPDQIAAYPTLQGSGRVLLARDGAVYEFFSSEQAYPDGREAPPRGSSPFFAF